MCFNIKVYVYARYSKYCFGKIRVSIKLKILLFLMIICNKILHKVADVNFSLQMCHACYVKEVDVSILYASTLCLILGLILHKLQQPSNLLRNGNTG